MEPKISFETNKNGEIEKVTREVVKSDQSIEEEINALRGSINGKREYAAQLTKEADEQQIELDKLVKELQ